MAITIKCPACSARMTLRDDLAGKKIRCPKCQQALRVPDASAAVDSGESKPPAEIMSTRQAGTAAPAMTATAISGTEVPKLTSAAVTSSEARTTTSSDSSPRQIAVGVGTADHKTVSAAKRRPGLLHSTEFLLSPCSEDEEALRKRIAAAFSEARIQPVRISAVYRIGIALVAVLMILLPVIYLMLILAVGAGVWHHAVSNTGITTSMTGSSGRQSGKALIFGVTLYLTPILSGITLIVFMLKPLFSGTVDTSGRRSLKRSDEPILFDFVTRICRCVNAPVPNRIDIDCDINASASFRRGLRSFFSNDLVLTIGMPLAAGLTMRQFGGVLAHEFGHFAQGAGMRLSHIIRSINYWFSRVVYERDVWDEKLEEWSGRLDFRIGWTLYVVRFCVWLTRGILWCLMIMGQTVSGFLMRQMEFDADRYEARFSGSKSFTTTARQLHVLGMSFHGAMDDLSTFQTEGRLGDNFPKLILLNADQLTPKGHESIDEMIIESRTGLFDTHPSDRERIASAASENANGVFQLGLPAAHLFRKFDTLAKAVTWDFYKDIFGSDLKKSDIHPVEELMVRLQQQQDAWKALNRFFRGHIVLYRPFQSPDEALKPVTNSTAVQQRLQQARNAMLQKEPAFADAWKQFDDCDSQQIEVRLAEAMLEADLRIPKDEFTIPLTNAREINALQEASRDKQAQLLPRLLPFEQASAVRLYSGLRLAQTPEFAQVPAAAGITRNEIRTLIDLFRQLNEQIEPMLQIRDSKLAVGRLFHAMEANSENEQLMQKIKSTLEELHESITSLQLVFADIQYPFDHAKKGLTVAEFLVPRSPPADEPGEIYEAADTLTERYPQLHGRVFGRLCQVTELIETHLGLPVLDEPEDNDDDQENHED